MMHHQPIQLIDLSFCLSQRICFQNFNVKILHGERIGLIGRNGTGKSSLLKMLAGCLEASEGEVCISADSQIAYVPQIIEDLDSLSGGERFNYALTQALATQPNVLLLDEPTNHLDKKNQRSLAKLLTHFAGTLIIASHDTALLNQHVNKLWHIENAQIKVFQGGWDAYQNERVLHHNRLETEMSTLKRDLNDQHEALMKEQERSKKRRSKGEKSIKQKKWPTIVSKAKMSRGIETANKNKKALNNEKARLAVALQDLQLPKAIIPKFHFRAGQLQPGIILSIQAGEVGYTPEKPILQSINLSLSQQDHLAIKGRNGSGKSTLVKAIYEDKDLDRKGEWLTPKPADIAYLDQHYQNLQSHLTVFEIIQEHTTWDEPEIRKHLNAFLFRKNTEVHTKINCLSGGEKARLSLALIAARAPTLLILDEITNNIDLETKQHTLEVLQAYEGALIIISHDEDFLKELKVNQELQLS